jgi:hypothetical protein
MNDAAPSVTKRARSGKRRAGSLLFGDFFAITVAFDVREAHIFRIMRTV